MIDVTSPAGLSIGHSGQGPGSVSAVYFFPNLKPSRTIAAFAPVEDQGVVERAVVEQACRTLE
jgi:D-alanyl-D-alanine carboxypeptidase